MKPKVKAAWIAALRSGEYKQGGRRLRNGDAFCCLGVLCNLHAQAHPRLAATQCNPYSYLGREGTLPIKVMRWAGLSSPNPNLGALTAAEWNDGATFGPGGKPHSFTQIADLIEKHL